MNFLESLYSVENFGIYLFVVIGILVVLFLIILFFGKKDEKKRKEQEQQPKESVDTFEETTEPVPVEIPVVEPNMPIANMEETEVTPVIPVVENIEVPLKEEKTLEKEEKEFDFDALAAAISKELESIEDSSNKEKEVNHEELTPVLEKEVVEPILPKMEEKELNFPVFEEPVVEKTESKVEAPEETRVENIVEEEKKPMPRPTVFSSVYVNRNLEEPKIMEEQQSAKEKTPIVDSTTRAEEKVIPVAPKIELPKMMDLPKKK